MAQERRYKISDDKFRDAINTSKSINEAKEKMGLARGDYPGFKRRAKKLNIDISHLQSDPERPIRDRKTITDQEVLEACKNSFSNYGVFRKLHIAKGNESYKWIKEKISELSIDNSHWTGRAHIKGKTHTWTPKTPLEEILVENSEWASPGTLKTRLISEKILEYKCSNPNCGIIDWQNQFLSLQLDHINGVRNDNRIENLRLLCPNCHSQTPTYCKGAKGLSTSDKTPYKQNNMIGICTCGGNMYRTANMCKKCYTASLKNKRGTIPWPEKEELEKLLQIHNTVELAKLFQVNNATLVKRLKRLGIVYRNIKRNAA